MAGLDMQRERLAALGATIAFYPGPVLSFEIRPPYYLASCDGCGWVGSSEACGTDDADDVFCPRCHRGGADCGRVAVLIGETVDTATAVLRADLEEAQAVAWMVKERRRTEDANKARPVCGKVFMSRETAAAAAVRLSNRWKLVEPFPVFALERDVS